MSADLLAALLRVSLVASAAIALVLFLRRPLRYFFGAQASYWFWLLVPISALAAFLPARSITISTDAEPPTTEATLQLAHAAPTALPTAFGMFDGAALLLAAWALGTLMSAVILISKHRQLLEMLRAGNINVGPAVIGVISPRVLLPVDFERRYTEAERRLVVEHEREHIKAGDLQVNALAALVQCANWFNPLVYMARAALRIDQELACDERVMRRHSNARSVYAQAMLKAQLAQHPEFGCAWPPFGEPVMKQRILMLGRNPATFRQRTLATALLISTALAAATTAWASQPPRAIPESAAAQVQAPVAPTADISDYASAETSANGWAASNPTLLSLASAAASVEVEPATPPAEMALSTTLAAAEPVAEQSREILADSRQIDMASGAELQHIEDFDAARTKRGILRMFGQVPGRGKARADRAAGQRAERERRRAASN